jgi:hypothetical protein
MFYFKYILNFFCPKLSHLSAEAYIKTKRHLPAKMNQQEATRAVIACGLGAGRTMKEIVSKECLKKFIASGGHADSILTGRQGTGLVANLDELITRDFSSPICQAQEMNISRTNMRG